MTTSTAESPRIHLCSVISADGGESPFGSVGHTRRRLVIELPLPWRKPAIDSPNAPAGFTDIVRGLWAEGVYPLITMVAPDDAWSVKGQTRIVEYRLPEPPFSAYDQREYLLPSDRVADYLEPLLRGTHGDALEEFRLGPTPGRRDFMVCTHGAVDACCATFGYPIYKLLRTMADNPDHGMRVWRCTHFGGHRFAPTMVEMPLGRYWGHLEARDLGPIVRRNLSRELIRKRYRGWAALPYGVAQWAECELFAQAGWDWIEALVTPGDAPSTPHDAPVEDPQRVSFAFRHAALGIDGEVDVMVTPDGFVRTADASGAEVTMRDAQQFVATVIARPSSHFFGPSGEALPSVR